MEGLNQDHVDRLLADIVHHMKFGEHLHGDVHTFRREFCEHRKIPYSSPSKTIFVHLSDYYLKDELMDLFVEATRDITDEHFEVSRPKFLTDHSYQMLH